MPVHQNPGVQRRFIISMVFTGLILVAEVIGGLLSGSLALLSDAAHVFMDLFALGLSLLALRLSALPADDQHSFGWHRLEVFAALFNGITLLIIAVGIWVESVERLTNPVAIHSTEMLIIAVIGLVVNVAVALVLGGHDHEHEHDHTENEVQKNSSQRKDLNLHSAFLHVVGDAISSIGVIIAALLIQFTNILWIDPLISILIGCIILVSAYRILRASLHILIEGVPEGLSIHNINERISSLPGVVGVHDLHVWCICSGVISLSAHIVVNNQNEKDPESEMLTIKGLLSQEFQIEHTTIQFEVCPCMNGEGGCN